MLIAVAVGAGAVYNFCPGKKSCPRSSVHPIRSLLLSFPRRWQIEKRLPLGQFLPDNLLQPIKCIALVNQEILFLLVIPDSVV